MRHCSLDHDVNINHNEKQIVLKPRKLIDPSQGWYWTKE